MTTDEQRALLVAFIRWYKGYRAEFCKYPTADDAASFLSWHQSQEPQDDDPYGVSLGRPELKP